MKKPRLSLVGAGPGDPELITLKAIRAIKAADAILYDALANPELLEYAKLGCHIEFVGKRYGCHSFSQQEINDRIVKLSRTHAHVVRLKGGDPFIFGRAQEEIEVAESAGMEVVVVPGISSALAVAASNRIPLTCRGVNESFWVTTGTTAKGDISADLQWAARSSATVVILMAMSKLEEIMDLFVALGKQNTPVAIIQNGTRPNEKKVFGTVRDIVFKSEAAEISNPAIILIGEVVALYPEKLFSLVKQDLITY
ncbi:MAG: uroporphyrinogen-III C-methyltransferase [Bacteroidota bacterium]